jgi:DNA-directed RNA polymerase subunit F
LLSGPIAQMNNACNRIVDQISLLFILYNYNALVHKLTRGSISPTEAHELRALLKKERHILTQQGSCLAFFAVRFLINYVDEYLESKSNSFLASRS